MVLGREESVERPSVSPASTVYLRPEVLAFGTGYGDLAEQLGIGLDRLGIPVRFAPARIRGDAGSFSHFVIDRIDPAGYESATWSLQIGTPNLVPPPHAYPVIFTMQETDGLNLAGVCNLNRAWGVIVPCQFNADSFRQSGVSTDLVVCPLGIDPTVYHCTEPPGTRPFVFGTAGRTNRGGVRKGLDLVATVFSKIAHLMPDARLVVKCWPEDDTSAFPEHHNIVIDKEPLPASEMPNWYRSLSCYVTASRGEAWGLQTHQAMAVGRPVIAIPWSGTMEFWTEDCGWPISYDLQEASVTPYRHAGRWAIPDRASLANAMLRAYGDHDDLIRRGQAAAKRAAEFTWDRTAESVASALVRFGMLDERLLSKNETSCTI